ncbi:hypothetical protein LXJ15735_09490 [Lacrimispora xylanolytica]
MQSNIYKQYDKNGNYLSVLLGVYVLMVGIGLPLVFRDFYFDILKVKYYYYCICTITMIILVLVPFFVDRVKNKTLTKNIRGIKFLVERCTIVDTLIILYWLIALISTLSSDYFYEAFWGNEGRFTGLFLITLYVLSYFCVSRFWKFKSWYIDLVLLAGMVVCIFGITDYFDMDILHFKAFIQPSQRPIFTSTIGNINTYTSYVGIIAAISTILFATEKRILKMCWYYVCVIISFFAIIMGVSDNAYLSLAALFGLSPIYLFKNKSGLRKYLIIIATFFTVAQCIDWVNTFFGDRVLGVDSVFKLVISFKKLHYIVIMLWSIIIIWCLYDRIKKLEERHYGKKLINVWIIFIVMMALGIVFALYDCNIAGNSERYSFAKNYLFFDDDWGTHRGYIWRNAIECYIDLPFWKKIIGYGPETFGILMLRKTINNPYKEIFDSAHNEYLHMLITVGIAGLITYIGALFIFIHDCLKKAKSNYYIVAIAFGVICYSTQAFVNLNLPIVTPIFWLLLGIGETRSLDELKE